MSSRDRKEAMVRTGDTEAMMAAAMKQAEAAMQQMQGVNGAAMTPEMAAAMAQVQQAMAGAGMTSPGPAAAKPAGSDSPGPDSSGPDSSGPDSSGSKVAAENALPLDANLRGTIEYEHPEGAPTTLVILDRQSGKELFRKEFDDGSVYEYVDFGRYQLPLNQITVVLSDAGSRTLRELAPVMAE
jgi:hypothetical protein